MANSPNDAFVHREEVGGAGGVAPLGDDSKLPVKNLPDRALTTNGARPVGKDELIINVYDFGAVNSSTVSSDQAFISAMDAAAQLAKFGQRARITIPYGRIRVDAVCTSSRIEFWGPGAIVGTLTYQDTTVVNTLRRFHSLVHGITFENPAGSRNSGLRFIGASMVEVTACQFNGAEKAVQLLTWPGLEGQQNKTINVHDNVFVQVDFALFATQNLNAGESWSAHADCQFRHNIIRLAYISAVWVLGADGFDVCGNVLFAAGWDSTDPRKLDKRNSIYFGRASNWIKVLDNQIFESGHSGVYLEAPQAFEIRGNHIAWPNQVSQAGGGVYVNTSAGITGANQGVISGNIIDLGASHGIAIAGDGDVSNIVISADNNIRLYKTVDRPIWIGSGTPNQASAGRVFVTSSVVGYPKIDLSESSGSRDGVIIVKGVGSLIRRQTHRDSVESLIVADKTVVALSNTAIGQLYSTRNTPGTTEGTGNIRVIVRNYQGGSKLTTIPTTASYFFTVDIATQQVTGVTGNGRFVDRGIAPDPVFTFTVNTAGALAARAVNATAGTFEFSVHAEGAVVAGYLVADLAALPVTFP